MDDTISRKAAIDAMAELQGRASSKAELKGISKAWKMIKQLPPARPEQLSTNLAEVGTDCISRQALLDKFEPWLKVKDYNDGELNMLKAVLYEIRFMRPAQPERIKGHWIESNGLNILMKKFIEKGETWRMCDKCGAGFMIGYQYECDKLYHETFHNFCPKCGAEMEVTT